MKSFNTAVTRLFGTAGRELFPCTVASACCDAMGGGRLACGPRAHATDPHTGIKYPVILGGLTGVGTPELAAAVSKAGGLVRVRSPVQ